MEGDDEWEDHLIVSYTPPQGCEMTMTEFERLKANTKLEIFRIHNDMTPEELEAIPAECSKTVAVCRAACAAQKAENKYLYFLGPSSTPGEYWAGVGHNVYRLFGRNPVAHEVVCKTECSLRYILNWNDSIVVISYSLRPIILDKEYRIARTLERVFGGLAQRGVNVTPRGFLLYSTTGNQLIEVARDYTEKALVESVNFFEWHRKSHKLIVLTKKGILLIAEETVQVDIHQWLIHHSGESGNSSLLATQKLEKSAAIGNLMTFRCLRGSHAILGLLDNCQLCLCSSLTLLPIHLSDPPSEQQKAINQMGLCKPVRGVEMVLCSANYRRVLLAAVFRQKVYQMGFGAVGCIPWAFTWFQSCPITFGMGQIDLIRIVTKT